ncbi:MAG: hypothetical protein AB7E85_01550 [Pseudobdellovibrionaceae bacterium]
MMLDTVSLGASSAGLVRSAVAKTELAPAPIVTADSSVSSHIQVDPYISRQVNFLSQSSRPIIEFRDTSTGSTVKQFPTEAQIRAYSRQQSADQPAALPLEVRQSVDADTERQIRREVAKKVAVKVDAPQPEPVKVEADAPKQVSTEA